VGVAGDCSFVHEQGRWFDGHVRRPYSQKSHVARHRLCERHGKRRADRTVAQPEHGVDVRRIDSIAGETLANLDGEFMWWQSVHRFGNLP